jgi:transcriptional regulator GlxA family with amidase domain
MRLEGARTAVETNHTSLERVAQAVGFGDLGRMPRALALDSRRRPCGGPLEVRRVIR